MRRSHRIVTSQSLKAFHPDQAGLTRFWLPGELVTGLGTAGFEWGEQTGSDDDFVQATTSRQPNQTTDNGTDTWEFTSANNDMIQVASPSAGMTGTGEVYLAFWAKWNTLDATFDVLFDQGTRDSASDKGFGLQKRNSTTLLELVWSSDGTNNDNTARVDVAGLDAWMFYETVLKPTDVTDDIRTQLWMNRVQESLTHTATNAAARLPTTT